MVEVAVGNNGRDPQAGSGSTRERIISVAMELFAQRGYGGTSLREIADQLGVTKAAIYYHFHTKEDIAQIIVERIMKVYEGIADRMAVAGSDPTAWQRAFDQIIDMAIADRELFMVWDRNDDVFQKLFADHAVLGPQIEAQGAPLVRLFGNRELPTAERIKLGCAYGAVMGPLMMLTNYYNDISAEELRDQVRTAVGALLSWQP